jgi:hypothetical protein
MESQMKGVRLFQLCVGCNPVLWSLHVFSQVQILDDFESLHGWNMHKSGGVDIAISQAAGRYTKFHGDIASANFL